MSQVTTNISAFSPDQRIDYSENGIVSQQIIKSPSGNITLFAFDKEQQLSEHSTPFEAVVHILEGNAKIEIAGHPHLVEAGEMIVLPASIPHAVYATTAFKMLLIMIKDKKPVHES